MVEKQFDVFMAHRSVDKPMVRQAYELLSNRGIRPWLDENEIIGGIFADKIQKGIRASTAAAIFIGAGELTRWQALETTTIISECVNREMLVIPVLLPGVSAIPEDLIFLRNFNFVSFQFGLEDERALSKLVKSIEDVRPIIENTNSSVQKWFVNVGEHRGHLRWEDCVSYSCISAGGGPKYMRALQRLKLGDTVYAYITGSGYVGAGEVLSVAVPINKFITQPHNTPLVERELVTTNINDQPNKLDTDWAAGIKWFKTFDRENASRDTEHYITTACEIQDPGRLASLRKTFGT